MMKTNKIRYLCVDDEPDIESTRRRLEAAGKLKIDLRQPKPDWTDEVEDIHRAMTGTGYSGLLIDFRLDETHHGKKTKKTKKTAGKMVRYTAESLVSELRRRSVEGGRDESYPIVLWSTAKFLKQFYELNPAYVVSYDSIWDKEILANEMAVYGRRLTTLSKGYQQIAGALRKRQSHMSTLLAATDMSVLIEFEQFMQKSARGNPYAFQYALFITHDILEISGPLIDTATLQAFLGVEELMPTDRAAVLAALGKEVTYRGVFADSYDRFWREKVLRGLEGLTGASSWLSLLAEDRIKLLKQHFKSAKLHPAKPLGKDYSTDYDCVCAATGRPLAKRNGFRVVNTHPLPWKESEYIAGTSYRLHFADLSRNRPLEAEDKERFAAQFKRKA